MRTLYLPIYEPGSYHDRAVANKHGLRTAFEARGPVLEWDYLTNDRATAFDGLLQRVERFVPDLVFTQLGSTEMFTAAQIARLRAAHPNARFANWNGDFWPDVLLAPDMLDMLRQFDVQLVVNGAVLPDYAREGVRAAYWPFGYETPNRPLPDVPAYDVVYLGNCYSEARKALYGVLRALPCRVGFYGAGWPQADGECTYDFTMGEALYRNATLTLSDSQWLDADGYLSNRPFQALAAGGALLLQQRVRRLDAMTGLRDGVDYVGFDHADELPTLVDYWLHPDHTDEREAIVRAGQANVQAHHTFEARVTQLVDELLPALEGVR